MIKYKPAIVVVSAASGTGKTTVINRILEIEHGLFYSVSATTRPKRPNEKNGKDYIFIKRDTFQKWIKENKLLEWAEVYGEYYGTPKEPIEKALSLGQSVIADLDVNGMKEIKKHYSEDAVSVFLFPPDFDTLIERLKNRGTETESQLKIRIERLKHELANAPLYDYWVLNDSVEHAARRILSILHSMESLSSRLSPFKIHL